VAVQGFADLDFEEFHRTQLPQWLAEGNGELAASARGSRAPLALQLADGSAYTYVPEAGGIRVEAGDTNAETVIELGHAEWEGLVHDYESAAGLLYGGKAKCRRGKAIRLVEWEPRLRAMFTGRPPHDPYDVELLDRNGEPLDPEQAFSLQDLERDRADMAHFLRTCGYLFVRDVFTADEAARFLGEAHAVRKEAVKGDKLSWWATNEQGQALSCRVTRAGAMPGLRAIPTDGRVLKLVELADDDLAPRGSESAEESISVIFKLPEVSEGLANLPWHRDCGMGGHSVMCPVLVASVFLSPSNPDTGDLRMLPGSWSGTCPFMDASDPRAPKGALFDARPGDVSLHYSDVMHAAPPPARNDLDSYRVSAVTGYTRSSARNHRGRYSYNDVLHQREDGQIEHLTKVAERQSDG
jgi:ectoine hydroxylase-related dioxygenase (phytanoyl-CoA dioxygenase family)